MSFPALETFADDPRVTQTVWRVYMHLQRRVLDLTEPRVVKSGALADALHTGDWPVTQALNWLVTQGYLVEHARGWRGVRRFTLAWSRATSSESRGI